MRFSVIFSILFLSIYYAKASTNNFKVETAAPCPNNKKLTATILNMTIFNTNGKLCVNAEIELKETIKGSIPVNFHPFIHNYTKFTN